VDRRRAAPAVGTDVDDGIVQGRVKKDRIAVQIPDLQARESTSAACDASNQTPAASLVIARQKLGFCAKPPNAPMALSLCGSTNARLLLAIVMSAKGAA